MPHNFDMSSFNPVYQTGIAGGAGDVDSSALMSATLLGKVNKLSGKGWSYHFRLLKMN